MDSSEEPDKAHDGKSVRARGALGLIRSGGRDLTLLVLGILAAFWLDAAWDASRQRKDDRELLADLSDEFRLVVEELQADSTSYQTMRENLTAVASQIANFESTPDESMVSAIRGLRAARTLDIPSGAYAASAEAGVFARIEDAALRNALGAWPATIADTREGTEWLREHRDEVFLPLIDEFVSLYDLTFSQESPVFESRPRALLRDRRFAGSLAYRDQILRNTIGEISGLLKMARQISESLTAEVGTS